MSSIGAYEAKTHFPELLNRVESGEEIVITRRGIPVARLIPIEERTPQERAKIREAIQGLHALRKRNARVTSDEIREMIDEGRRF